MDTGWVRGMPQAVVDGLVFAIERLYADTPLSDTLRELTERVSVMPTGMAIGHPDNTAEVQS